MPRPDGLHGGGRFVPLHEIAEGNRQKRAERRIEQSLNKEAVVTQEDEDPSSEESMELHRRDPDLHHGRQLGQGMLAELSFKTDVLMAPSPIETDPVMRPGYQHRGSCSCPPRRSPRREPKPNRITDPKVNLLAILQCEGLTKAEADQFSSSTDPDDDQDSNFDALMDPMDAGSEVGGVEETNENEEQAENVEEEDGAAQGGDDNASSGEAAEDAAGEVPGGSDSTGGGGSNGSGDDDGDGTGEGDGEKASGDEDDDDEEEDGEEGDAPAKETPRDMRIRLRMRPMMSPLTNPPCTKRARKPKPGQCTLACSSLLCLCRVTQYCCLVT